MNGIDLNTVAFVRAVVRTQPERLKDEPPTVPDIGHLPEDIQTQVEESALRRAQSYDFYRDIRVLSLLLGDTYVHYVVPEDPAAWTTSVPIMAGQGTTLIICGGEVELLARFWDALRDPTYASHIAGWQIADRLLPLLINKAMQANIRVPDRFLTDITRRFGASDKMVAVDAIYSQSAHAGSRPLPELADMLTWWGVPQETGQPYPSDRQLLELDQSGWMTAGCAAASKYLWGMRYLVAKYYGYVRG